MLVIVRRVRDEESMSVFQIYFIKSFTIFKECN